MRWISLSYSITQCLRGGLLLALLTGMPALALAESARLMGIHLDSQGVLQLEVAGDGFDPLLNVTTEPDKTFRITCSGSPVQLDRQAQAAISSLQADIRRRYPSITQVQLLQEGSTIRLTLASRQKLLPRVLTNTGSRIAITLAAAQTSSASETKKVASTAEKATAPRELEGVELDLDQRLAQRRSLEEARRKLIKAQEQQWLSSVDDTPKALVQVHEAPKWEQNWAEIKPEQKPARITQNQIVSLEPASAVEKSITPIKLTPAPANLEQRAQKVYQSTTPSISGNSLYAIAENTTTAPVIREAIRQALQGQREMAISQIQNHLKSQSSDDVARTALALILLNRPATEPGASGERTQAVTLLKQVVAQLPYMPAYEALITAMLDDGRLSEAETLLEKAELLDNSNPAILFLRGRFEEASGRLDNARNHYRKVLLRDPHHVEAHYRLAQIALKSGKPAEARWELAQVLQVIPQESRALKLLAYLSQKEGSKDHAMALYQQALQPDALLNFARLLHAENPQKALTLLQAVEMLAEDKPDLLFNLGMTYADLREAKRARAVLSTFMQLRQGSNDPRIAQAQGTLGKLR
jgi:tetratricopeptide (TPR) repeat protein